MAIRPVGLLQEDHMKQPNYPGSEVFVILVEGHLDEERTYWFEGLSITNGFDAEGKAICTLRGPLADQAALHGLLAKIRDMNLSLLSVSQDVPASGDKSQAGKQGEDQV
jgi:hypothetical protein